MVPPDTFLLILYVLVDDFCKTHLPPERHPGPAASLSRSEVVTLALFSQWAQFGSERGFYRYADRHLRMDFPHLPHRSQLNRLLRAQRDAIVAFGHHLADVLGARTAPYEALDGSAVPVRNAKRRGRGWLAGLVDLGWSNRLGWYEDFHLLTALTPEGVITGFGFGSASTNDHPLAESFFALRRTSAASAPSVGHTADGSTSRIQASRVSALIGTGQRRMARVLS